MAPASGKTPSLMVLPFANQCDDGWFADGVTEDLITAMARSLPFGGPIMARGTSFAFKGKASDPRELGRELGVDYVLDGRARRRGGQMRIVAELVDTRTGAIAWAQSFDRDRADLELVRDEIVARISNALRCEMAGIAGERARRKVPGEIAADDLAMQGWAMLYQPRSIGRLKAACRLFEEATAAGPCPGHAGIGLAMAHTYLALGMDTCPDRHAEQAALALDLARGSRPIGAEALLAEGLLLRAQGHPEEACRSLEQAVDRDPNNPYAHIQLGFAHRCAGRPERLFPLLGKAMSLSPFDPETANWLNYAALAAFDLGRLDEGVGWARKALRLNPDLFFVHFDTAAELARAGRVGEARSWLASGLATGLIRTVQDYAERFAYLERGAYAARFRQILAGLRLAGLPAG